MPNLQSVVIVLLKEILTNITAIASQSNGDPMSGQKGRYVALFRTSSEF